MNGLARGVYSVTRTKRRRFLWCAWWKGDPVASPFRAPDAWGGGARTEEDARRLAEEAVGAPLDRIEGRWAGAWVRVREGLPPFKERTARPNSVAKDKPVDPFAVLGVTSAASLEEVKAAFRKKALENHPDRGGSAEAFIRVKRAFDTIVRTKRGRCRHPRAT